MKRKVFKLLSIIACLSMICTFISACNTSSNEDKEGNESTELNNETTYAASSDVSDTKSPDSHDDDTSVPDPYITYLADVTRDYIPDKIVVDTIAATDESAERKTVWITDGATNEEIWSTTLGKGNLKKGGVYLYKDSQTGHCNLYFWQTYMVTENALYVEGYYVFSKNYEGKVEAIPVERKNAQLDVSNYRTIERGKNKFLGYVFDISSMIEPIQKDIFTLLDTSSEQLVYSTPERKFTCDELFVDFDKCIVYAKFE